ncbi:nucleoside diphosphate kinase regulator [Siccirubricoccus sp. G192]|uniref:nucleoside diphosphate kinase regulator n=1 Tax=Siccirubricoccus sp. G192 TaxID=2849651 RepID=UPI001C2B9823|nr:nucleoside diphosphate kinase regulator [Siccirubricoccus sp. G192]MBV1796376.1 nucleoside diphosphate kinase regulator [Siccirubricoccus sp. G192]
MPTRMGEAPRPPVVLSVEDHTRLVALASVMLRRSPLVAQLLIEEAGRAEVVPAERLPAGAVAVGSRVEFRDAVTGEARWVRLVVLPSKADIADGRISVLSLVGAGLMGLSEGQSIDRPAQDGRLRRLTVLRVEAAEMRAAAASRSTVLA